MGKRNKTQTGYVKKETMLIVAFITLVLGFLLGAIFSAYKFGSEDPAGISSVSKPPAQMPQPTPMDLTDRILALERETSLNPDQLEGWVQLGNAYFDTDQYEKAITAYRKSLEIDPKNPNVWTDMGVMYRRKGDPNKAVEAFDQAASIDPKHEISRFNKGIVLLHDLKDMEGAVEVWEEILRMNPFATAPNGQPLMELVTKVKEGEK